MSSKPPISGSRVRRSEDLSLPSTEVKNQFGRVLDRVIQGKRVFITKHDVPRAVLLSIEDFEALAGGGSELLDALAAEFDELFARMQTPEARSGMQAAFEASPARLADEAVAAALPCD